MYKFCKPIKNCKSVLQKIAAGHHKELGVLLSICKESQLLIRRRKSIVSILTVLLLTKCK